VSQSATADAWPGGIEVIGVEQVGGATHGFVGLGGAGFSQLLSPSAAAAATTTATGKTTATTARITIAAT
jgi:hypothetical protein